MRFSIWASTSQSVDELLALAVHAESTGWDTIYLADSPPSGHDRHAGERLEAWTAIAAIAALVGRLGVGVFGDVDDGARHPGLLANLAATVDRLSGGRHVLWLGAAAEPSGEAAAAVPSPERDEHERVERLTESCKVVRLLLTNRRSDFAGRHFSLSDAPCEPRAQQSPFPIGVSVRDEADLGAVVDADADRWSSWGLPEEIALRAEVLRRRLAAVGRQQVSLGCAARVLLFMGAHRGQVEKWQSGPGRWPSMIGTSSEIERIVAGYAALGVDELVVFDRTLGDTLAGRFEAMDRFQHDIASRFRADMAR